MNALSKSTTGTLRVRGDTGVDRSKMVAAAEEVGLQIGRSSVPLVTEKRLAWTVNQAVMAFMVLPENQGKMPTKLGDLLDRGQDLPPLNIKVKRYRDGKRTDEWAFAGEEIRRYMRDLYMEIMLKTNRNAAKAEPEREDRLIAAGVRPHVILVPLKGGEHSPAASIAREAALKCHTAAKDGVPLRAVVKFVGYDFEPESEA